MVESLSRRDRHLVAGRYARDSFGGAGHWLFGDDFAAFAAHANHGAF